MRGKEQLFDQICQEVRICSLCARMSESLRVLNGSVGSLNSPIMFIGEAPGRLGADGSGIPFHGDKAGHNFEELLAFVGLNRSEIFVTNAVLCNPRDENGNNAPPNSSETKNCSNFLARQIELVDPKIIVTLGANPLNALRNIEDHKFTVKESVRTVNKWGGRILIPLYHPGQRAMIQRSMANQRSDYQFVADQLKKVQRGGKKKDSYSKSGPLVSLIVEYIFSKRSSLTYFALHKLFYLVEYKYAQKYGKRITNAFIVRQKDGPYCVDLHLFKIKKALPYILSKSLSKTNILLYKPSQNLFIDNLLNQCDLDESIRNIIDEVIEIHGNKSNAALKRTVYFTRPMRNILFRESTQNVNLYNTPIQLP